MSEKLESPALEPERCDPRCCWHWGVGRRVCCKCGATRVDREAAQDPVDYQ